MGPWGENISPQSCMFPQKPPRPQTDYLSKSSLQGKEGIFEISSVLTNLLFLGAPLSNCALFPIHKFTGTIINALSPLFKEDLDMTKYHNKLLEVFKQLQRLKNNVFLLKKKVGEGKKVRIFNVM